MSPKAFNALQSLNIDTNYILKTITINNNRIYRILQLKMFNSVWIFVKNVSFKIAITLLSMKVVAKFLVPQNNFI